MEHLKLTKHLSTSTVFVQFSEYSVRKLRV